MNNVKPILYTIRPGDTLYNIAIRYGVTVQDLIDTNLALDPYYLRIGQQIYIYPNYCISKNQVNLLKDMNLVWEQHIMWTRMLLISIAEDLKDLDATRKRLLENPKDIANIFRKFYGNAVADTIEKLLTEHLVIGEQLITALKNNNKELASELNTKWYKNAEEMANAFSSINPLYPKNEILQMLNLHLKLTTDEVAARLRKDYSADIKAFDMVQREILKMSEFFVSGIVKQFSNLF